MALPTSTIPVISNNSDATPSLWNTRYSLIDDNFAYLENKTDTLLQGINRIINGDFSIWQRGLSKVYGAGQFSYLADRFLNVNQSNGQFTTSRNIFNGSYSMRTVVDVPCTTLSASYFVQPILYIFDGNHLYDLIINNKQVTLSFSFVSNVTGNFSVSLRNILDLSGAYNNTAYDSYVTDFNYTTPNVSQKISITIQMPNGMNGGVFDDNSGGIILSIGSLNQGNNAVNWAATTGNYIDVTQIQLEEGNLATKYEYMTNDILRII